MENNSQAQSAQAQSVDLSGFARARDIIMEMRSRGVVCAIWGMAGTTRNIKDAPFCWQHKEALQRIRDYLEDGHGHCALALSVYVALSQLASDAHSETFTAPISEIARRAAVSYRTAAGVLKRFEALELIAVQRSTVPGTKEHAPSTYTMLRTPCLTLGKQNQICLPKDIKEQKQPKELISPATAEAEGNSTSNAGNKPSAKVSASYPLWVLEEKKKYPEAQDHPLWQKTRQMVFNTTRLPPQTWQADCERLLDVVVQSAGAVARSC